MDEISTGLDSSTTYQIVKCIKNFVHQMEATVLMALLQPAPETFELFDDLVLLSEGHVIYEGPREDVLEFFESIGFQLPPRKGIADFLQEVSIYISSKHTLKVKCFIIFLFNLSFVRSPLKRIKHSTGLIPLNHMNLSQFVKLQKPLEILDLEGIWTPYRLNHMINQSAILQLWLKKNMLCQNWRSQKLALTEKSF
jgi:ABC-type multidrug transport system ATPase subunit